MLRAQEIVWCPVGKHVELGYRTKGQSGTFVCRECAFVFPIDKNGEFGTPINLKDAKNASAALHRRYCGPEGCICRD